MENVRTLKVCELWREGRYRDARVPQVRLNGKWLREAGFDIGDKVHIIPDEPSRLVVITSREYPEEVSHDYAMPKLQMPHGDGLRSSGNQQVHQLHLL